MGFEPTIFGVTGQYVNRYTTGPEREPGRGGGRRRSGRFPIDLLYDFRFSVSSSTGPVTRVVGACSDRDNRCQQVFGEDHAFNLNLASQLQFSVNHC